jgi:hypothetical protein
MEISVFVIFNFSLSHLIPIRARVICMVSASIFIVIIHDTAAKRGHFPTQEEDILVGILAKIEISKFEHRRFDIFAVG